MLRSLMVLVISLVCSTSAFANLSDDPNMNGPKGCNLKFRHADNLSDDGGNARTIGSIQNSVGANRPGVQKRK